MTETFIAVMTVGLLCVAGLPLLLTCVHRRTWGRRADPERLFEKAVLREFAKPAEQKDLQRLIRQELNKPGGASYVERVLGRALNASMGPMPSDRQLNAERARLIAGNCPCRGTGVIGYWPNQRPCFDHAGLR